MKDLKISKELLSEVLKMEVVKHSLLNKSNKSFNVTYMQSEDSLKSSWTPVNIYEFAFKCKEWVLNKGYSQLSGKDDIYEKGLGFVCSIGSTTLLIKDFYAGTEVEAIVKACTHIFNDLTNLNSTEKGDMYC